MYARLESMGVGLIPYKAITCLALTSLRYRLLWHRSYTQVGVMYASLVSMGVDLFKETAITCLALTSLG